MRNAHEWSRLEGKALAKGNESKTCLTNTGWGIDTEHGEISSARTKAEQRCLHILRMTSQIDEGDD